MWRHLGHSLQGDSHRAENSPCQDSHSFKVLGEPADSTFIACVADGAGSSKHSEEGSAIACEKIIENAAAFFESCGDFDGLQATDVQIWCEDARRAIEELAESRECTTREFATTICTAIVSPTRSCFFQIGDGAIILGCQGVYGVAFWPQSGEYANSTNFLTGELYRDHLEFFSVSSQITDLALFTDGIERIALVFEGKTPHPPFFEPLFRTLRSTENPEDLNDDFCRFLQSDSVKSRSDDDKTLVLASLISEENASNV